MNLIDLISKHPVPVTRFQRPYVIAEAGVNHEGSMDIARRLIDEAAEIYLKPYLQLSVCGFYLRATAPQVNEPPHFDSWNDNF